MLKLFVNKLRAINRFIQWRVWGHVRTARCLELRTPLVPGGPSVNLPDSKHLQFSSISSGMQWPQAAEQAASNSIVRMHFRRYRAVYDVVETVGPIDGFSYARLINKWNPEVLANPGVQKVDKWGGPVRWPSCLLRTPVPFSPTTLRYIATALWLKRNGFTEEGGRVVELGVGFGGLAALQALLFGIRTKMVDLPQVEKLAMQMLTDLSLNDFCWSSPNGSSDYTFLSNYAFTELAEAVQDKYFIQWIQPAARGAIISNASVFSRHIGGRSDSDLVAKFASFGINVQVSHACDLFTPADIHSRVTMITWQRVGPPT